MDVVRAAEMLTLNSSDLNSVKPKSPGGPKSGDIQKTTTIVMSKHTLAPQADQVSDLVLKLKILERHLMSCALVDFFDIFRGVKIPLLNFTLIA